jgi:hypothetical protein
MKSLQCRYNNLRCGCILVHLSGIDTSHCFFMKTPKQPPCSHRRRGCHSRLDRSSVSSWPGYVPLPVQSSQACDVPVRHTTRWSASGAVRHTTRWPASGVGPGTAAAGAHGQVGIAGSGVNWRARQRQGGMATATRHLLHSLLCAPELTTRLKKGQRHCRLQWSLASSLCSPSSRSASQRKRLEPTRTAAMTRISHRTECPNVTCGWVRTVICGLRWSGTAGNG